MVGLSEWIRCVAGVCILAALCENLTSEKADARGLRLVCGAAAALSLLGPMLGAMKRWL